MDRGEGADSSPWKSPKREMNPLTFHGLAPRSGKFDRQNNGVRPVKMNTLKHPSSLHRAGLFAGSHRDGWARAFS